MDNVLDFTGFTADLEQELVQLLGNERGMPGVRRALGACAMAAEACCTAEPAACGPGCPHCCVLNVAILLPEGIVIADWLLERLAPAELTPLRQRLARHRSTARWMTDEERIFARQTCPFLDETGSCGIHPVRPLVCRGAASFDRESCRQALRSHVLEPEGEIAVDLRRQLAYDAAFIALAQALDQQGLDDRSIELGSGVAIFLEEGSRGEKLLAGERLPKALWLA
jgi:Fe-S-cluster containining protein